MCLLSPSKTRQQDRTAFWPVFRPKMATFAVLGPHPPARRTKTGFIVPATTANPAVLSRPPRLSQRPRQRPSKNRTVRFCMRSPGEVLSRLAEACLALGRLPRPERSTAKRPRGLPMSLASPSNVLKPCSPPTPPPIRASQPGLPKSTSKLRTWVRSARFTVAAAAAGEGPTWVRRRVVDHAWLRP